MRQRNAPLKELLKKSPIRNNLKDYFKTAVKVVKPLVGKAAKKALGPVGLLLGATKTATADQAQEIHNLIRNRIAKDFGEKTASSMSIIYGGSMKPDNARELLAQKDIDGGLIGGASLDADTFAQISTSYSE